MIHYFFQIKTYYVRLHAQKLYFNSGKNLLTTLIYTEKSTVNIPNPHRKHNVKKYPFHNILSQLRLVNNLKIFKQNYSKCTYYILEWKIKDRYP